MAKKQTGERKVVTAEATGTRHARIELSDDDYERLKRVAKANGLSVSAFIRMAVLQRIRKLEAGEID